MNFRVRGKLKVYNFTVGTKPTGFLVETGSDKQTTGLIDIYKRKLNVNEPLFVYELWRRQGSVLTFLKIETSLPQARKSLRLRSMKKDCLG